MYHLFPLGVLFAYNTALQCNIHAKSRDRQGSCFLLETFPSPGDLPDPGIEPTSLASPAGRFFITKPPGKHICVTKQNIAFSQKISLYPFLGDPHASPRSPLF